MLFKVYVSTILWKFKKINKDIYKTFKYLKLNQTATASTISLKNLIFQPSDKPVFESFIRVWIHSEMRT